MRRPRLSERIAACALRHWKAAGMTGWPTVRQVAKRLHITNKAIEEEVGEDFQTTEWNCLPRDPFGEHFVEAMTQDVDKAWCRYYFPINRRCTCDHHTVVARPNPTTNSYELVDKPSR